MTTHTLQPDYATWTPTERRDAIQQGLENLVPIVVAAYEAKDWEHFGFANWKEYGQAALGGYQLGPAARKETVLALSKQKLSQRAIAAVVGTSKETVRRDIAEAATNVPLELEGLDGKTYPRKKNPAIPPEVVEEPEVEVIEVEVPGTAQPEIDGEIEDAEWEDIKPEVITPESETLPKVVVRSSFDLGNVFAQIVAAADANSVLPISFVADLVADIRTAGTVTDEQADEIANIAAENMTQLGLAFDRARFMAAAGVQELVGSVA